MTGSGRQIETVTAEQAEVVSQDMTVERFTELGTDRTATDAAGEAAKDGARYRAESDTDRTGDYAECCAGLAACQSSTDATCEATDSTEGRAGFHGMMERSDFGGVTARALQ